LGCFSFICQVCKNPILSNSHRGERVRLFLLKNGLVIEEMEGQYSSYGTVLDENGQEIKWEMPWDEVCKLIFDEDERNGIAAIHTACSETLYPTIRSEDDPDQGWGADGEVLSNPNWTPSR